VPGEDGGKGGSPRDVCQSSPGGSEGGRGLTPRGTVTKRGANVYQSPGSQRLASRFPPISARKPPLVRNSAREGKKFPPLLLHFQRAGADFFSTFPLSTSNYDMLARGKPLSPPRRRRRRTRPPSPAPLEKKISTRDRRGNEFQPASLPSPRFPRFFYHHSPPSSSSELIAIREDYPSSSAFAAAAVGK